MTKEKIQIGIIEDDSSLREGLAKFFDLQEDLACSFQCNSVETFLDGFEKSQISTPDVLMLDINLPGITGTEGLPKIKEKCRDTLIIMLTINNDPDHIFKALSNGAVGYVLKGTSLAKIKEAILDVHNGGSAVSPVIARKLVEYFQPKRELKAGNNLTEKEVQLVQCLVDGLSYKLTADRLNITLDTVRFHIRNIYKKLEVNSKSEVVSKSLKGEIRNLFL